MLMKHSLCDDVGGKHNVCGMENYFQIKSKHNIFNYTLSENIL